MKRSTSGKRRAYVLGAIHLFIVAHFVHWLWAGKTLSPIEPSESVEFFRYGIVNPGLIFFALAILATMIFGRYLCGWGCHLVAYQDLMLAGLKRFKMRPKAFRSRFLIFVPLIIAAGWMFLVPIGYRIWLMISGEPFPLIEPHLTKIDYWSTFARVIFGAATILICGFLIIYFLGPKGFCTYACPYGAFFALADKVAPYRIRVNDNCEQCGHCTAVCTSNVNVSEEVNRYGMVVDPGCMKCLDCVQVCPNDALSVSPGRPALFARSEKPGKPKRYDMSLPMEFVALAIFLLSLMTINGLYGQFPFLMSLGVAACITFVLVKAIGLLTSKTVMFQKTVLKTGGQLRKGGWALAAIGLLLTAFLVHSGLWRYHAVRSNFPDISVSDLVLNRGFESVQPPEYPGWYKDATYAGTIDSDMRSKIDSVVHHLNRCNSIGLFPYPDHRRRLAWLYAATDRRELAVEQMRTAVSDLKRYLDFPQPVEPQINYLVELAKYEAAVDNQTAAKDAFAKAIELSKQLREKLQKKTGIEAHELSAHVWLEYGVYLATRGEPQSAKDAFRKAIEFDKTSSRARLALAQFVGSQKGADAQRVILIEAVREVGVSPEIAAGLVQIRFAPQNPRTAIDDYQSLIDAGHSEAEVRHNLAVVFTNMNQLDHARRQYEAMLKENPDYVHGRFDFGSVLYVLNDLEAAGEQFATVLKALPTNSQVAFRLGVTRLRQGRMDEAMKAFEVTREYGTPQENAEIDALLKEINR